MSARAIAIVVASGLAASSCATPSTPPSGPSPSEAAAARAEPGPDARPRTPGDGRSASQTAQAEPSVEVLLDEGRFRYDAQGRKTAEYILRYRILRARALETDWAVVEAGWSPWRERRPEISATVKVDGKTLTVDPKSIEESGSGGADPTMFRDYRRLRAPLPGLAVGALVETHVITSEERPFFTGGATGRFYFGGSVRTETSRATVTVPKGRELSWVARGFEITPRVEVGETETVYVFEGGPYEVLDAKTIEPNIEPHRTWQKRVEFSLADSWAPIAAAYAKLVDERIAAGAPALDAREADGRDATIRAVLDATHDKVRYTGLELGAASIEPTAPSATLSRGYGDCKDKATVVVAALRARGIEAYVALLRSSYTATVPESVPSLMHFDHAIVYVPGPEPRWIDATVEVQPVEDIPISLQGRQALVAKAGVEGLVTIPELPSALNLYRETRTFELTEFGPARVVEVSQGERGMDRRLRYEYQEADEKKATEALEGYAKEQYAAPRLTRLRRLGGTGVEDPFRLELTVDEAGRGFTAEDEASVLIDKSVLLQWLPRSLRQHDPKASPRKSPFFVYEPYRAELEYRVTPPPGFVLRDPPAPQTVRLGPATFERTVSTDGDVVVVGYRFDVGARRYSPEDTDAFARALAEWETEEQLTFDYAPSRAMAAGQVKDALTAHRELVAAHPKSGATLARYAKALLDAGFGLDARRVAKEATEQPSSKFFTHFVLGLACSADEFGRGFERGMDRDGSLAAFRVAQAEQKDNRNVRYNIALLLQFDAKGRRFAPGHDLGPAIAELEAMEKELEDANVADELRVTLYQARRWQDLEKRALKDPPGAARNAHLVAAVAVNQGIDAAKKELTKLGSETDAVSVMQNAGRLLFGARKYPAALDLMRKASQGADLSASSSIESLANLKPYEEAVKSMHPGAQTVFAMAKALLESETPEAGEPFLSRAMLKEQRQLAETEPEATFLEREWTGSQVGLQKVGSLGIDFAVDSMVSIAKVTVDGSDALGYRVESKLAGPQPYVSTYYLVKERGELEIRAGSSDFAAVGAEAMARLERGDVEGARQWVAWGHEAMRRLTLWVKPREVAILQLWSKDKEGTKDELRVAAAALMAGASFSAPRAVKWLEKALTSASGDDAEALHRALLSAYRGMGKPKAALRHAKALLAVRPEHDRLPLQVAQLLTEAGDLDGARAQFEAQLAKDPDDVGAIVGLSELYFGPAKQPKKGLEILDAFIEGGRPNKSVYNLYAWSALFTDAPRELAVTRAEQAAAATKYNNLAIVHTLACAYADGGRPAKAMVAFKHILKLRGRGPKPADWYVLGRIAEAYDLKDTARRAYREVKGPDNDEYRPVKALAQAGLRRLRR